MDDLSQQELIARLTNYEDAFVERKSASDSGDWVKTVVAFANSAPVGYPAVLYIGVRNDGSIEGKANLDSLQVSLNQKISLAYPTIYYLPRILEHEGKQCLAVIIPGSAARPHFAGPAYIRVGSETRMASEQQFVELIASRRSKVREILKWKGKKISADVMQSEHLASQMGPVHYQWEPVVIDCNQHYVTLDVNGHRSIPLSRVEISFDDERQRLKLEISPV